MSPILLLAVRLTCWPGAGWQPTTQQCEVCPENTWSRGQPQEMCKPCPSWEVSGRGAAMCRCNPQRFGECNTCNADGCLSHACEGLFRAHRHANGFIECVRDVNCPAGHGLVEVRPGHGAIQYQCVRCPRGQYAPRGVAPVCTPCDGTVSADGTVCSKCWRLVSFLL
jgi:hypothetical protein